MKVQAALPVVVGESMARPPKAPAFESFVMGATSAADSASKRISEAPPAVGVRVGVGVGVAVRV